MFHYKTTAVFVSFDWIEADQKWISIEVFDRANCFRLSILSAESVYCKQLKLITPKHNLKVRQIK